MNSMVTTTFVLALLGFLLGLYALWYSVRVAGQVEAFNENVKAWAQSLDEATRGAIDRSARELLRQLDERITAADVAGVDNNEVLNNL